MSMYQMRNWSNLSSLTNYDQTYTKVCMGHQLMAWNLKLAAQVQTLAEICIYFVPVLMKGMNQIIPLSYG